MQWLRRVVGQLWFDKFGIKITDYFSPVEGDSGNEATIYFGVTGALNIIYSIVILAIEVAPNTGFYSISWLILCLFHLFAWTAVEVMWILQSLNGKEWVRVYVDVIDWVKYITVWGGYAVMFIIVFLSTYILPAANVDTGFLSTN